MNPKKIPWCLLPVFVALVVSAGGACAQARPAPKPFVSPIFTDNMVLQRDRPIPVWGWAAPGAKVTVQLGPETATTRAGEDGRWLIRLGRLPASGPYTLTVTGPKTADGPQVLTLTNVLLGDVWFCSGQSNMEMGILQADNGAQEAANADYPGIRLYTVPRTIADAPLETTRGEWLVCTPENIRKGNVGGFSAVAYFFGRALHEHTKVPIGLIHSSWGGTIAEAWTSAEGLEKMPEMRATVADVRRAASPEGRTSLAERQAAWFRAHDAGSAPAPGGAPEWAATLMDTAGWSTMDLPAFWEDAGLPNYNGVAWFRKEVTLPESAAGKPVTLRLGLIDDQDTVWFNRVPVGGNIRWDTPRVYSVPAGVARPDRNVIAVRVLDTASAGGFRGKPEEMRLEIPGEAPIPLAGPWLYRATADLSKTPPYPQGLGGPNVATVLYNGMVAPVVPYGLKGAIWYQGESNSGRAWQYRTLLPTMIADWRKQWDQGNFPFLIVQLANYMERKPEPSEGWWAEVREAQALTAQTVPNVGLAVAADIGDAKNIHPTNKQDVGKRLALAARKIAYGEKGLVASGPTYRGMKVEGSAIRLTFDNLGGGLVAKDDKLAGFAIAGPDRKYVWAEARIEGDTVIVSSPNVANPVAVRYAWADNPEATLYNKAGLPAVPFRTDGWPLTTQPKP